MSGTFPWPCDRRDAHKPHEIETQDEITRTGLLSCPGVSAHPATMIGGAYPEEPARPPRPRLTHLLDDDDPWWT